MHYSRDGMLKQDINIFQKIIDLSRNYNPDYKQLEKTLDLAHLDEKELKRHMNIFPIRGELI